MDRESEENGHWRRFCYRWQEMPIRKFALPSIVLFFFFVNYRLTFLYQRKLLLVALYDARIDLIVPTAISAESKVYLSSRCLVGIVLEIVSRLSAIEFGSLCNSDSTLEPIESDTTLSGIHLTVRPFTVCVTIGSLLFPLFS